MRLNIVASVVVLVWAGVSLAQTTRASEATSGRTDTPMAAQRIVSLAPHATELLYPLLQAACAFMNEMASFADAGVSGKT